MSASSSRRPETRSQTRQILKRKHSVQHRYVHILGKETDTANLAPYPDTSCTICDPPADLDDEGYHQLVYRLSEFDPQLTISRENQLEYFKFDAGQNRSAQNLARRLKTFTFWKIPANYTILARTIIDPSYDVTVLPSELTEEEIEDYQQEVIDNWIVTTVQVQPVQINYPDTPVNRTFTPLRQEIRQGSQLIRRFQDIFFAEEDNQSRPASPLTVQTIYRDSIDPTNPTDIQQLEQAREEYEQEQEEFERQIAARELPETDNLFDSENESESENEALDKGKQKEVIEGLLTPEDENAQYLDLVLPPRPQNQEIPQVQPQLEPAPQVQPQPIANPLPNPPLNPVPNPIQQEPMARNADYPVFDGSGPATWIQTMEIAFAANNVAAERKVNIAAAHLGKFVNWFASQPAFTHWTGGQEAQNRNFKEIFLAHFQGPEERESALAQMWKRRQRPRENIVEYANELSRIWKATGVEIPPEIQMSQFISGLDPSIQNHVKAQNPQDLNEAIAASKRVYHGSGHASYLTMEEESPMVTGLLAQVAEMKKEVEDLRKLNNAHKSETQAIQRERYPRVLHNVRCSNCNKMGHTEETCWFKNKKRVQCFNCKGYGHMQKDCWARARKATPSGKGRGRP